MSNRVAVITGAGRGLGSAIALDLARRGVDLVLAGRSVEHLHAVAAQAEEMGARAVTAQTDVTDADSVAGLFTAAVDAFGQVDVLVNNAGITTQVNLVDLDEADWDRIFDTNVRGMFLCTRAAGRLFAERRSGRVVNVASVFGLLGRPGFSAYCASKGAVINFTRSVASEWARFGAQINAVAPGYIATDINAEMRADEKLMSRVVQRIPARRMGEPEELANVVGYLALDAPDFLTGQTVVLDGGESSV